MSTAAGHDHGIRRAIATVCLSGMLEDKLDAAAAAGFDGVEVFEPDLIASSSTPAEVRNRCADLGLSIDLYQPFRDFDTVQPDQLTANLRRAEHKFDVMEELGTDMMLVCSSVDANARVFFEVVQRVGSYSSYGSANSAVRMTAQRGARTNRPRPAMPAV